MDENQARCIRGMVQITKAKQLLSMNLVFTA